MKYIFSIFIFCIFIIFQVVAAEAITLVAAKGSTSFLTVGRPSALKIKGKGEGPTGELTLEKVGETFVLNGEALLNLETLDTGIGLRDQHMKEKYLEVGQYKIAKLKFLKVVLPAQTVLKGGEVNLEAVLALHGHENPVALKMNFTPKGNEVLSQSQFKVKLSAYGVEIPKYLGVTVADEVTIIAETTVKDL